jgi:hypothetical protein
MPQSVCLAETPPSTVHCERHFRNLPDRTVFDDCESCRGHIAGHVEANAATRPHPSPSFGGSCPVVQGTGETSHNICRAFQWRQHVSLSPTCNSSSQAQRFEWRNFPGTGRSAGHFRWCWQLLFSQAEIYLKLNPSTVLETCNGSGWRCDRRGRFTRTPVARKSNQKVCS